MRVAMIVRSTIYSAKGGDTIQVLQTAAHLSRYAIKADILMAHEKINYAKYDVLHFFNITRPADMLLHIWISKKPFVISTIFIDYSEYDKYHRKGFKGWFFRFLNADNIEYVKNISRWILRKDPLVTAPYLWKGQRNSILEILGKARVLLPNSHSEYRRLIARYNCNTNYIFVPNGVDPKTFVFDPSIEKDPLLILCVARIEGIKNQLNLILALRNTKYKLMLIGSAAPNQKEYYNACRKMATNNITFIDHLPQERLVGYYQRAKVHVLPSWFETTGLSSLEAGVMGCNIVITDKGDASEYFEDEAVYCDPVSPESIYEAVKKATELPFNASLRKKILSLYTWEQATIRTIEAYER
ncbi:MAG: glycosyltransferase family 4 protein [Ferruginibacter sp.]